MIKVGTVCFLRRCHDPALEGVVCTTTSPLMPQVCVALGPYMGYEIDIPHPTQGYYAAAPYQLVPISDPDFSGEDSTVRDSHLPEPVTLTV